MSTEKQTPVLVNSSTSFEIGFDVSEVPLLKGRIRHIKSGQENDFKSFTQLLVLLKSKLDSVNSPQPTSILRQWGDMPDTQLPRGDKRMLPDKAKDKKGKDYGLNFLVQIKYLQNSSWQGTVQWLDANKTVNFRSDLELILLMQQAIDKTGIVEKETRFQSWDDEEE